MAILETHADAGDDFFADLRDIETYFLARGGEFLLGFMGDKLVAMGAFLPRSAGEVEIMRMRVHPKWHRRGFGRAILRALEERAVLQGSVCAHVETTAIQIPAIQLYRKNGYSEIGRGTKLGFEIVQLAKRF